MTEYRSTTRDFLSNLKPHRKIALIFGVDVAHGDEIADKFHDHGYKTAVVCPHGTNRQEDHALLLEADVATLTPPLVGDIFAAVMRNYMEHPSVIVFNASQPGSGSAALLVAAEAIRQWQQHPNHGDTTKLFLYTGDIASVDQLDRAIVDELGLGQEGQANWMDAARRQYSSQSYRFFHVQQDQSSGASSFPNGEAFVKYLAS